MGSAQAEQPRWKPALLRLVILLLVAAAANIPVAVLFHRPGTAPRPPEIVNLRGLAAAAKGWPVTTPHPQPWPAPTQWVMYGEFGHRRVHAYSGVSPAATSHSLELNTYGWPIASLQEYQFWWPWNDPAWALTAPSESPLMLRWQGVVLNPLIFGGGLWALLFALPIAAGAIRRSRRGRRGQCPRCGYDLRHDLAAGCPECGWNRGGAKL